MRLICVGESHLACVIAAAEETGTPLSAIALRGGVARAGRLRPSREEIQVDVVRPRELQHHRERLCGAVASFVGGMGFIRLGLREHPTPFDFVLPQAPDLPLQQGVEIVPFRAIHAAIAVRAKDQLSIFEQLVRLAEGPVYHFETPPPPTAEWLSNNKIKGVDTRWSAPALRYKIWYVHRGIAREHAIRVGGRIVSVPAEATNDEGLLKPGFCGDGVHANAAYGALVLAQMKSLG